MSNEFLLIREVPKEGLISVSNFESKLGIEEIFDHEKPILLKLLSLGRTYGHSIINYLCEMA